MSLTNNCWMAATMKRPMAPPIGANIIPRRAEPGVKTEGIAFWGLGLKPGFCCTPANTSMALRIADITMHTSAKTSGLSREPLRGTPREEPHGLEHDPPYHVDEAVYWVGEVVLSPDVALLTPMITSLRRNSIG